MDEQIRDRKRGYLDTQEHILAEDANRNFFKHVRNFSKAKRPALFDVRDLMPKEQSDKEIARNNFNREKISDKIMICCSHYFSGVTNVYRSD